MSNTKDIPDVKIPPLLIAFLAVAFGFFLDWLFSTHVLKDLLPVFIRSVIGIILVGLGAVLNILSIFNFHKIGTPAPPWQPTLKLSTQGIYSHIRNPIYVGFTLIIAGIGIGFASDWILFLLIPYVIINHVFVVLREEVYLERKFGDDYRIYKARVPRYGWR